ncbi:TRAP transporter substrate-binding protein [Octadecabacter sp.]|nr:TRAP transporter substrate-binding protein [Octadecabacter sp.]
MGERITFGGYQGDKSVHTRGARAFGASLSRLTDGEITVDFRQNIVEDGHKASDLLDMTDRGELDGCYFSSSYLAGRVPELALFDQHFAVPTRAHAYGVLDGFLGQRLAQEVAAKTGYVVMNYWDNGLRHISTADTPLNTPANCKDLKLRTLASDDHQRVFRALGFDPMPIDVRDLPDAVKSGVVDAQENPLTNIYNFDLHKTHRTITLTGHLLGVALVLFNAKTFAGWSVKTRDAVTAAMVEATQTQRQLAQDDDAICTDAMINDGVTFVELSPKERATLAAATHREVAATRARFSTDLIALFENDLANVSEAHL